jgi:hypothetical protein
MAELEPLACARRPARKMQQTTKITCENYGGATGLCIGDFVIRHASGNFRIFDGEESAKAAADFLVCKILQFQSPH